MPDYRHKLIIVSAVEDQTVQDEEFKEYLKNLLKPYEKDVDAVVLGCTHFPFIKDKLASCFRKRVRFYVQAVVTAAETRQLLETNRLLGTDQREGSVLFLNSDPGKISLEERLLLEYERQQARKMDMDQQKDMNACKLER